MSLINEALKRTEDDKLDRSREVEGTDSIPLVVPGSVASRPCQSEGREWRVWLTVAAAFLICTTVLWAIMQSGDPGPSRQPAPQRLSGGTSQPPGGVTWQGADKQPLRRGSDARIEAALAMQKTDTNVLHYRSGKGSHGRLAPVDSTGMSEEDFGDPAMPSPFISAARPAMPTHPNRPIVDATRTRSTPASPARPPGAAALWPLPTATASPSARTGRDPTQPPYQLTGIVQSDTGRSAIINGIPIRAGQTLGKAKVLRVDPHTVVLQIDGKSSVLGL